MPEDIDIDLDLTDPRTGYRPTPAILEDAGGDEKAVTIERKAKDEYLDHLRSSIDRARRVVEDRLDSARPRRERAEEELERVLEGEREAFEDSWGRKTEWLQQRAKKAKDELPELTDGPASVAEDDIRQWVREGDADERQARIREIVTDGPDEARRALFRSDLPPGAAGFASAEMRERALEEALRRSDPEAFETVRSVRKAVGQLTEDLERFHETQTVLRNKAMREFDRWASE